MSDEQARTEERPARWSPWTDLAPYGRWGIGSGLTPLARMLEEMAGPPGLRRMAAGAPAIDVDEDEQGYEVSVELPGVAREDIDIQLEENLLTIRGEKRHEAEGGERKRRWTERSFGAFQRAFTLPPDADADRMEASYRDGVLRIQLPKTERSKPRSIAIKS